MSRPALRNSSPFRSRIASESTVRLSRKFPPSRPMNTVPRTLPFTSGSTIRLRICSWPNSVRVTTRTAASAGTPSMNSTAALTSTTRRRRVMRLEVRADREGDRQFAEKPVRLRRDVRRRAGALVLDPLVGAGLPMDEQIGARRHAVQRRERARFVLEGEERAAGRQAVRVVPHIHLDGQVLREVTCTDPRRVLQVAPEPTLVLPRSPYGPDVGEQRVLNEIGEERIAEPQVEVGHEEQVAANRNDLVLLTSRHAEHPRGIVDERVVRGFDEIDEIAELILLVAADARGAARIKTLLRRRQTRPGGRGTSTDGAQLEPRREHRSRRERV